MHTYKNATYKAEDKLKSLVAKMLKLIMLLISSTNVKFHSRSANNFFSSSNKLYKTRKYPHLSHFSPPPKWTKDSQKFSVTL